ncbi:hypothetical protein ARMGADRAFT_1029984 [Armillaria gallica]|uniref:Uncharacterized protein n=1 Tax=Armillaria gallica TaxID=47427 RepID=A0A2H3DTL0_ARMGA|nr:hypothetical protein ARMGADRAFT_1029984 [Armillaria gallica]
MSKPGFEAWIKFNIHNEDAGGELNLSGSDLARNPLRDFTYSSAFGADMRDQVFDSTVFVGVSTFRFRACDPARKMAADCCRCIYDLIGCDSEELMGTATSHPGDASTPILSSSQCTAVSSIGGTTATGSPA